MGGREGAISFFLSFLVKIAFVSSGTPFFFPLTRKKEGGKYEKCTHSLGSQKNEKNQSKSVIRRLGGMMMYVLSFKKHSQEQRQKGICFFSHFFFSFPAREGGKEGGRGNIVANRRKALGRLEAAMNQTKD